MCRVSTTAKKAHEGCGFVIVVFSIGMVGVGGISRKQAQAWFTLGLCSIPVKRVGREVGGYHSYMDTQLDSSLRISQGPPPCEPQLRPSSFLEPIQLRMC